MRKGKKGQAARLARRKARAAKAIANKVINRLTLDRNRMVRRTTIIRSKETPQGMVITYRDIDTGEEFTRVAEWTA